MHLEAFLGHTPSLMPLSKSFDLLEQTSRREWRTLGSSPVFDEVISGLVRQRDSRLRVSEGSIVSYQRQVSGFCGAWVQVRDVEGEENHDRLCENCSGPSDTKNTTAYYHGKKYSHGM